MKSFASLLRAGLFTATMALLLAAPLAQADDEGLPPPQDGLEEEVPFNPPAQEETDDPLPTLGDDALPSPAGSEGTNDNVVNSETPEDDIFLPAPGSQDTNNLNGGINYAPVPTNSSVVSTSEGPDWRYGWNKRPVFSLHGGMGFFTYPVENIEENKPGPTVGASIRIFDLGQTVFLHAYGSFSWVNVGGIGPFSQIKDTVLHVGPMVEIGLGRRISLYGALLRRSHTLSSDQDISGAFGSIDNYTTVTNEGWKLGVGLQYDFYVIPHGSLGIRAHVETDMSLVALTMSLEPAPRKRLSLNFKEEP